MNSRVVLFRLSIAEHQHLQRIAEREGDTVSDIIREALYRRYGIGSIAANSFTQGPIYRADCNTPRS